MTDWQKNFANILFIVYLTFLTGCSDHSINILPAIDILNKSAEAMQQLKGFNFRIEQHGEPTYLDAPNNTIAFRRIEGSFVTPDKAIATIRIITPGLVTEIEMVGMGDSYWETNFLTGDWQLLPTDIGFNPALLFDPSTGMQSILKADINNITLIGLTELEEMPGIKQYHLSGDMRGESIYQLSYGMIGETNLIADLWIDPSTFYLNRVSLSRKDSNNEVVSSWLIDFWDFNNIVSIEPPKVYTTLTP